MIKTEYQTICLLGKVDHLNSCRLCKTFSAIYYKSCEYLIAKNISAYKNRDHVSCFVKIMKRLKGLPEQFDEEIKLIGGRMMFFPDDQNQQRRAVIRLDNAQEQNAFYKDEMQVP